MKKMLPILLALISTPCFAQAVQNPFSSGNISSYPPMVSPSTPSTPVYHQKAQNVSPVSETNGSCVKVWMNESSHVYHIQGSKWYGKTKNGKYECEAQAISEGGRKSKSD